MLFNQLSKKRILENKITTFLSITEIKSPLFLLTHLKSKKNWHQQGRPILPQPHPARSHLRSNHRNATLPQCRVAPWCDRATNPTVLTVPTPPHCHPARSADATLPTLQQCRVAPWCDRATNPTAPPSVTLVLLVLLVLLRATLREISRDSRDSAWGRGGWRGAWWAAGWLGRTKARPYILAWAGESSRR